MTIHETLKQLKELRDKATQGEWGNKVKDHCDLNLQAGDKILLRKVGFSGVISMSREDLKLVESAVNTITPLYEALEKFVDRLKDQIAFIERQEADAIEVGSLDAAARCHAAGSHLKLIFEKLNNIQVKL